MTQMNEINKAYIKLQRTYNLEECRLFSLISNEMDKINNVFTGICFDLVETLIKFGYKRQFADDIKNLENLVDENYIYAGVKSMYLNYKNQHKLNTKYLLQRKEIELNTLEMENNMNEQELLNELNNLNFYGVLINNVMIGGYYNFNDAQRNFQKLLLIIEKNYYNNMGHAYILCNKYFKIDDLDFLEYFDEDLEEYKIMENLKLIFG